MFENQNYTALHFRKNTRNSSARARGELTPVVTEHRLGSRVKSWNRQALLGGWSSLPEIPNFKDPLQAASAAIALVM